MARQAKTTQLVLWAFKLTGCVVCGVRYPELPLSEFHAAHIDPTTKRKLGYYNLVAGGGGPSVIAKHGRVDELLEELSKCEVVCAKHHRQRERELAELDRQGALFGGSGEAWLYGENGRKSF